MSSNGRIVALDVGTKRVGVASAHTVARLPAPVATLPVTEHIFDDIKSVLIDESAVVLVIGLPRGLEGQETQQTAFTREFGEKLRQQLTIPVYWQDEALTSHLSKAELQAKRGTYGKGDVDALAATYILEDFLLSNKELPLDV